MKTRIEALEQVARCARLPWVSQAEAERTGRAVRVLGFNGVEAIYVGRFLKLDVVALEAFDRGFEKQTQ